ncbi:MAG TPA: iron ABC transporter permease [Candidatus Acidoferrales bacterium]|nr:iron ABC transporter permease [Candidatus Acidoferrales bacterium]
MRALTPRRLLLTCALLAGVLLLVVFFSLKFGTRSISLYDLTSLLFHSAMGQSDQVSGDFRLIILEIRWPRILLAMIVGASLSVAGASFQALLRNPLADPYVLGVSSGAALGSILSLIWAAQLPGATPVGAFAGAVAAAGVVYFLGRRGGELDSYALLLGGIITASFLSALIMFLMTTISGHELRGMAFWLMGDLSTPSPVNPGWLFLVLVIAVGAIYTTAADLNLLLGGEQEAMHLGVDVVRVKLVVYLGASLLTGLAVSVSGAIGYVGLIVPHLVRLLFGSDYRLLIPATALGGAIAVVLADTLARTLVAPTQLPVGAMTALVGAPVFIYLLRRRVS